MTEADRPIHQTLAAYRAAILAKDVEAFAALFADDVRTGVSGDMATLTAFLTFRAIDATGKELRSLNNRLSWVLREQAGRWKVVQEHTSIPIDGATGKGIFKRLALA